MDSASTIRGLTFKVGLMILALIGSVAHADGLEALIQDIAGGDEAKRVAARQLLPREGMSAVPSLLKLMEHEDPVVWRAATRYDSWADRNHHNNFLYCVRTRQKPAADIEQGFRGTASILLAGVALKAGRKLYWDGEAERFINDEQANRYLTRAYRKPWRL